MSDSEQNGSTSPTEETAKPAEPPEAAAPKEAGAEEKLAEAQAESGRLREQLLRTAADFDNFRKRSRREADDAQRRGREQILKDLLPVFDNLERAAAHAESATDTKAVADGVRIVLKQFLDTLDRMGIKRIPTIGTPFDPSIHEAIQQIESTEQPAGVVIAEVQPGYQLGDYLIRAAMVVVSKGPPGEATTTAN
jgi:molecular chaperone GrpE